MTQYQSDVLTYSLVIYTPNNPYNHKSVISLHGAFGLDQHRPLRPISAIGP
jgi:hypothetical protein